MSNRPLTADERAEHLWDETIRLGLNNPTEAMITKAIMDAEMDALHNPAVVAFFNHDQDVKLMRDIWKDAIKQAANIAAEAMNQTETR